MSRFAVTGCYPAEPLQHQPVQPRSKSGGVFRQFAVQDLRLFEQDQAEIVNRLEPACAP